MSTLTEDQINQTHKGEFAAAVAEHGGIYKIPDAIVTEIQERTRQRWIAFTEHRDGGVTDPSRRHDKTKRLDQFVTDNIGKTIAVADLIEAVECSTSTAYAFVNDNRSKFVKVAPGKFLVVDVDAARAEAKTSTTVAQVGAALRALTGQES